MIPGISNRLHSRRGFLDRLVADAKLAAATGALASLGRRRAEARDEPNPWAYDVSRYLATDTALIH